MGQKERTLEEIAAELADYFIDAVGDKVEKMIISERLLREKVEGELEQTKSDARIIIDTSMAFQDEITKLKSELEEAKKNTSSNGEIFDCNILEATDTFGTCCSYHRAEKLKKENLSLSLQVNKLRDGIHKLLNPSLDDKRKWNLDELLNYAVENLEIIYNETASPKDIGKVVRETYEVLDKLALFNRIRMTQVAEEIYVYHSGQTVAVLSRSMCKKADELSTKLREIL